MKKGSRKKKKKDPKHTTKKPEIFDLADRKLSPLYFKLL